MRFRAIGFVPLLRDGARRFASVIPLALTLTLLLAGCGGGQGGGVEFTGNDAGTIAFEVRPDWESGIEGDQGLVTIGDGGASSPQLRVLKNGRYLRVVMFIPGDGVERDVSVDISHWAPGTVHSVTATWGDGRLALYADGVNVATTSYTGSLEVPPGTPLFLGSDPGAPDGALIEGFEHFGQVLDDSAIAVHAED